MLLWAFILGTPKKIIDHAKINIGEIIPKDGEELTEFEKTANAFSAELRSRLYNDKDRVIHVKGKSAMHNHLFSAETLLAKKLEDKDKKDKAEAEKIVHQEERAAAATRQEEEL